MVKGGIVVTHKCVRIKSSKISTFDLQQTKIFEGSSFLNRKRHCTTLVCENWGTRIQKLLKLSKEIWQYLLKHQIAITAKYLPSSLNVETDWQSWNSRDPSEWKLCPKVFEQVCQRREMPRADLLASRLFHQLPQYLAWKPNPASQRADVLQQIWDNQIVYAFLPFRVIL